MLRALQHISERLDHPVIESLGLTQPNSETENSSTVTKFDHVLDEIKIDLRKIKELCQRNTEIEANTNAIATDVAKIQSATRNDKDGQPEAEAIHRLKDEVKEAIEVVTETIAPIRTAVESLRMDLRDHFEEGPNTDITNLYKKVKLQEPAPAVQPTREKDSIAQLDNKPSYAQKLKTDKYTVVVESVDPRHTCDEVLGKVKGNIDIVQLGIGISHIKKVKNQKVLISCQSDKEGQILHEAIKNCGQQLTVSRHIKKNPLIKIKRVTKDLTDEKVQEAIIRQNSNLLGELCEKTLTTKIIRKTKARNNLTTNIILEVSPPLWSKLVNQKIKLGYQVLHVADQSPVIQCFRCLGFGHTAKTCTGERTCGYCTGNHDTRECESRDMDPGCSNCKKNQNIRANHPAYSTECPEWQKWDRITRNMIQYC